MTSKDRGTAARDASGLMGIGSPHWSQNPSVAPTWVPHASQRRPSGVPHIPQNLAPARTKVPQCQQFTERTPPVDHRKNKAAHTRPESRTQKTLVTYLDRNTSGTIPQRTRRNPTPPEHAKRVNTSVGTQSRVVELVPQDTQPHTVRSR